MITTQQDAARRLPETIVSIDAMVLALIGSKFGYAVLDPVLYLVVATMVDEELLTELTPRRKSKEKFVAKTLLKRANAFTEKCLIESASRGYVCQYREVDGDFIATRDNVYRTQAHGEMFAYQGLSFARAMRDDIDRADVHQLMNAALMSGSALVEAVFVRSGLSMPEVRDAMGVPQPLVVGVR